MFIQRAEFENFINIESGLGIHKLILDFSKQTNVVCVIVGRNGKGKTSILSYLTPFATLGNLDARDTTRLIIKGKSGYKRILIVDDEENVYDIKHFYTPSKEDNFIIKSYISLNGKELNENGNVTSFKNLVSDLLGLEMDYLKLIRIGDNVSNLIRAKSTERKVFMGKLLDVVSIYLKQHKEISQKEREVSAILAHIVDSLTKTNIKDIDDAKKELKKLKKEIERSEIESKNADTKRTRIQYDIEQVAFPIDGEKQIKELDKTLKKFDSILSDINPQLRDISTIDTKIRELGERKAYLSASYDSMHTIHTTLTNELDSLLTDIQEIEIEIEKERDALDLESLRDYLVELRRKKNELYKIAFDEVKLGCSKEEFEDFVVFLKNAQVQLNTTYEFGKGPIREVLKLYRSYKDVDKYVTSNLVALESVNRPEKMGIIDRLIKKYAGVTFSCEDGTCPYKKLHEDILSIKDATPVLVVKKDAEFYQMTKLAYDNFMQVMAGFTPYIRLIRSLPKDIREMFVLDTIYTHISNCETIYDEKVINNYLSFFSELETYRNMEKEERELEDRIQKLEEVSKMGYLTSRLNSLNKKAKNAREKIKDATEKYKNMENDLDKISSEIQELEEEKSALTDYTEIENTRNSLQDKYKRNIEKTEELRKQEYECLMLKNRVSQLQSQAYALELNMERFQELVSEFDKKKELYEQYTNLKYALSNRNGLPLYYIDWYMADTREIANELLDIVYDGSIYLEKFDITEDHFSIPYVKNGKYVADISSASQGEGGFFNMAISAALRAQSLTKYNIALLDEVDGAFDDTNRQKFIPVLDKMFDINHVQQAFVITHNQMFQQYPVDRLDLDCLENSTIDIFYE